MVGCQQVMAFMQQHFAGAALREKQNAKMRFEFPPQKNQTLAQMFGFIEVRTHAVSSTTPLTASRMESYGFSITWAICYLQF